MVLHASGFWCTLGYAKNNSGFVILLASMAWEAQLKYLEFDSRVLNVDCLVGTKSSFLWEHGEDIGWVKRFYANVIFLSELVVGALLILRFFQSLCFPLDYLSDFLIFCFAIWFFCFLLFIIMNYLYFSFFLFYNSSLITYQKKKNHYNISGILSKKINTFRLTKMLVHIQYQ